jgi:hypothetical protein
LNSPNDVVVKSDGSIWFTDPVFGLLGNYEGYVAESEIEPNVYRIDGRTGKATIVAEGVLGPNGLCFSPDEKILYIVESRGVPNRKILAYDVTADGTKISNKRVHIDAGPGTPDGMRCDIDGNLWCGWAWAMPNSTASWCSRPMASRSAASHCPSVAPMSALAVSSATACSWPQASRSMRFTSTRKARRGDSSWRREERDVPRTIDPSLRGAKATKQSSFFS